ncbi:MAG: hypothetical protein H6722_22530 [Sandaracinus sp.]|nr:hypothetical protein [Myxococcales bacterium]MCB9615223.1 hypothetical protein [Sandaracinus sp.]
MTKRRFASIGLVSMLWSCGGGAAEPTPEPESTTGHEEATVESTESTEGPAVAWADMNHEQKGAYMRDVVTPQMRAMFQAFDAEHYADFGCATCHGENAREVGFHMPNDLAPLNPANIPAMFQSEHPGAVFMTQQVWPKMVELLGAEPYNPETHEGFGCLGCHAMAD